jgi:hypothetical protein
MVAEMSPLKATHGRPLDTPGGNRQRLSLRTGISPHPREKKQWHLLALGIVCTRSAAALDNVGASRLKRVWQLPSSEQRLLL